MQLTIEVLPAPFGPMIENSSPSRIAKLTSVSALTPPNCNVTRCASRNGFSSVPGSMARHPTPPPRGATILLPHSGAVKPNMCWASRLHRQEQRERLLDGSSQMPAVFRVAGVAVDDAAE